MNTSSFCATAVALVSACALVPTAGDAVPATIPASVASPAPVVSPSTSPSPGFSPAVSDPCTSLSNVVSRPTFSTSTCAVKPDDLLIESGYSNATGSSHTSTVSIPQATLRAGLANKLEFDFVAPSYDEQSTAPKISGESDSGLGLKYEIGYTSKVIYGVNALYTLDTGSPQFSANGDGILANANAALSLSPVFGLFGSFGYNSQSSGTPLVQRRYHGFDPSLGVTLSLPMAFNVYAEGFGMSSFEPGSSGQYGFDAGVTKDIGSRLQLDAEYYDRPRLQNGTQETSVGFGASYLFGP